MNRTLIVSTSYPTSANDPAGHFVRTEALAMARAGADVTVLAPAPMKERDSSLHAHAVGGDELFVWPGAIARVREKPSRLVHLGRAGVETARAIRRLGPFDRAVLHFVVPVGFPFALALDGTEIELVAHGADVRLLLGAARWLRSRVLASLLDRGARFRFVARHLLDRLAAGVDRELAARLEAAAYVSPLAIHVPVRAELASPERSPRFDRYAVWVGRDLATKRLDLAIEAAERARVELVVVGVERARRGRAMFTGPLPRHEALAWIASASVLVSTSSEEGAPTAVREARALGVPVVACAAGDLEAWASRDHGIAVVRADATSLANAVRSAMALEGARANQSP